MDLLQVFQSIGISVIVAGSLTYLIKQFIKYSFKVSENKLKEEIELYKSQLSESLESHKSHLNELYYKASKLHDKRLSIIAKLYSRIVDLNNSMKSLTAFIKQSTGNEELDRKAEEEEIILAGECYKNFQIYFMKTRIYFDENTCTLLAKLNDSYWDSFWDYTYPKRMKNSGFEFSLAKAQSASDKVKNDIPPVLDSLENEFRKILSVND